MTTLNPNEQTQVADPSINISDPGATTLAGSIGAAFNAQQDDNPFSYETAIATKLKDNITNLRAEQAKGTIPPPPAFDDDSVVSTQSADNYLHAISNRALPWYADQPDQQNTASFIQLNNYIKSLKNPKIKSFEQLVQEVNNDRQTVAQRLQIAQQSTPGLAGGIARFAGGAAGFLADPINAITTALIPEASVAKTMAVRMAASAGLMGGYNAAQTAAFANPGHALAGEAPEDIGEAALSGAVLGAVGGGLHEGLAKLFTKDLPEVPKEIDTQPLRQEVDQNLENPQARAIAHVLDLRQLYEESNPYPNDATGDKQFQADLQSVVSNFPKADTAIAQALPAAPAFNAADLLARSPEELAAMQAQPDIMAQIKDAQVKLQGINQQLANIPDLSKPILPGQPSVPLMRLSNLLQNVAPEDAAKALDAERFLATVKEPAFYGDAGRAAQTLIGLKEKYFPDGIHYENHQNGAYVATHTEAREFLQKARTDQFQKLSDGFEKYQEGTKLAGQQNIARRWVQALKTQEGHLPDGIDATGALKQSKVMTDALPQVADQRLASIVEGTQTLIESKPGEPAAEPTRTLIPHEGKIDVGNGKMMDLGQQVTIAAPDGTLRTTTVAQFIQDLQDDKDLVEQMGHCAL